MSCVEVVELQVVQEKYLSSGNGSKVGNFIQDFHILQSQITIERDNGAIIKYRNQGTRKVKKTKL